MKLLNIFHFLLISIASLSFSSCGLFGCKEYNIKLTQIMNLLCNTTQSAAIQQRDACSGCFLRAATLPPGPRQLLALSQCASLYLTGTGYQLCATNLAVSQYRNYRGQRRSSLLRFHALFYILADGDYWTQTHVLNFQVYTMHNWLLWICPMHSSNECRDFGMDNLTFTWMKLLTVSNVYIC